MAEYYSDIKSKYKRPMEMPEIYNKKICEDIALLVPGYPINDMDKYLRKKRPYGAYDILFNEFDNNITPMGRIEIHDGIIKEFKLVDKIVDKKWISCGLISVKNKYVRFGKDKNDTNK